MVFLIKHRTSIIHSSTITKKLISFPFFFSPPFFSDTIVVSISTLLLIPTPHSALPFFTLPITLSPFFFLSYPERYLKTSSLFVIWPELGSTIAVSISTPSSLPFITTAHSVEVFLREIEFFCGIAWIVTHKVSKSKTTRKIKIDSKVRVEFLRFAFFCELAWIAHKVK